MAKKTKKKVIEKPALIGKSKDDLEPTTTVKEVDVVKQLQDKLSLEIINSRNLSNDKTKLEKEVKDKNDLIEAMVFQTLTSKLYYEQLIATMERQKKQ